MNAVKNSEFCKYFIKFPAIRLGYVHAVILNYDIAVFASLNIKAVLVTSRSQAIVCIHFLNNLVGFVG